MKNDFRGKGILDCLWRGWSAVDLAGLVFVLACLALSTTSIAQVVPSDDFEDGNALDWSVLGGDWRVQGGEYRQISPDYRDLMSFAGGPPSESYRVEVDVRFDDQAAAGYQGGAGGIVFRFQDELNFEGVLFEFSGWDVFGDCSGHTRMNVSYYTVQAGDLSFPAYTTLIGEVFDPTAGGGAGGFQGDLGPWRLSVRVDGTSVEVLVNGAFVFAAIDSTGFTGGMTGLHTYLGQPAFDNWQFGGIPVAAETGPEVAWTQRLGSGIVASALDAVGNLYVAESLGSHGLIRKLNSAGIEIWSRPFSPASGTLNVYGLCADTSGIYAAGEVFGPFAGQSHLGDWDGYVVKLDYDGNLLWNTQFGSSSRDYAKGLSTLDGEVYVVGGGDSAFPGSDAWLRKFDSRGVELWVRSFGYELTRSGQFDARSVAATSNGVFVGGSTTGTFPDQPGGSAGPNIGYLRVYTANGDYLWTRVVTVAGVDSACEVMVRAVGGDGTGVYVAGRISGVFSGQMGFSSVGDTSFSEDGFLLKYDLSGEQLWVRQFGSSQSDDVAGLSANETGVYIAGMTGSGFSPPWWEPDGRRDHDAFIRCYSRDGAKLWSQQIGELNEDAGVGVSVSPGSVYLVGQSNGATAQGFAVKFNLKDDDNDGVSTASEDSAPNGGDGNSDGFLDSRQQNVASLPTSTPGQFVTLVCPATQTLQGVQSIPNPSPSDTPAGSEFPVGFLTFAVNGLQTGATTTTTLILPPGASVNAFYKYGSTFDNNASHWYAFSYDGTTGAEILPDRVILHFVDGQRGDDDLQANGKILDPGAAVFVSMTTKTPEQELDDLINLLPSMLMESGLSNSLDSKLKAALASIKRDNRSSACGALQAFVKEVKAQMGKKLTFEQAEQLQGTAKAISTSLGCSR